MLGYASRSYAEVYTDPNTSLFWASGFILKKNIPDSDYFDWSSVYPFLPTNAHNHLLEIMWEFPNLVSSCFITNPLFHCTHVGFDYVQPYKSHAVVNLKEYDADKLPENHRRHIKKAKLEVSIAAMPEKYIDLVYCLGHILKEKHNITGITNYSKEQTLNLLRVPGAFLFCAFDNIIVNSTLFYILGNDVYYHLSYMSEEGYKLSTNFQVIHEACMFFKQLGFDRLLLGSVPDGAEGEGLLRFKQGFAAGNTVNNYIIKIINNREKYEELSKDKPDTDFFPKYRVI